VLFRDAATLRRELAARGLPDGPVGTQGRLSTRTVH
jgi:hypothetical protein